MAGENDSVDQSRVEFYRQLVKSYIDSHHYASALFWADKLLSLTNNDVYDVFMFSRCLLLTKQFQRAAHVIESRNLDKLYPECRYLAGKCHFESKEYLEALNVLDISGDDVVVVVQGVVGGGGVTSSENSKRLTEELKCFSFRNVSSSIKLLKGMIYEAMDNRVLAAECYKEALYEDVYCVEAFDALVKHQMLTAEEEKDVLDNLPIANQCSAIDSEMVTFLYKSKLQKYSKPYYGIDPKLDYLSENLDVIVNEAERHYYNCNYRECFKITTGVLSRDPFHCDGLSIHIAGLVELGKSNDLFSLSHKLVEIYPDNALSWFAIGCYYLLTGKNDPARRYLSKSTTLDRVYGPAWLAFAHSFGLENEHDMAMAAYFKASKLMKGCHLPLLYIGLEYGLTNNPKLAEKFFNQALSIAPEDPFVLHEKGVIAYQNQEYQSAEKYFRDALDKVESGEQVMLAEKWEPLLNNMGHVCRKLKKYEEALEYHQKALILIPQNASTYTAIGFVHAWIGNYSLAVDYFHKALGLKRDNTFSTTMLGQVIEQLMNEIPPFIENDEEPMFEGSKINTTLVEESSNQTLSIGPYVTNETSSIAEIDMDITE
ncbi:anaphase promoting complex subunit cdc16 [Chamberlinius hualienensis]